jgi:alginate O-acetyltransferase complex protein AlgI
MLFCSREFLIFFVVIFAAHWIMRVRWACIVMALLTTPYVVYTIAGFVTGAHHAPSFLPSLLDSLGSAGPTFWMAVIVATALARWFQAGHDQARVWLLLAASFYFYASWNKWLALIICLSTAVDYVVARGMEAMSSAGWRRLLLTISIAANLGLLAYFKYANFFLESLKTSLGAAGAQVSLPVLSVILPIGISFYTFEAINYTVDVYRRRVRAERNLFHFMLFILFFPHLVAGPIVRARDFLPQLQRRKRWSWPRLQLGASFFLMGLFKKLVIADRMAMFADPVFAHPEQFNTGAVWLAMIAYALQIYCDFSGYTDMALGAAHMLGYKLALNFNLPYLATNIAEFWRRWHISLSSWLRDYLFIPLGGSRGSSWKTCRNLMITMTLGGLWHGASWTFVVWGVLHGVLLVLHRTFQSFCERRPGLDGLLKTIPGTALRLSATFLTVCVGWVFFRAVTFEQALTFLQRLVVPHGGLPSVLPNHSLWYLVAVVAICHALAQRNWWQQLAARLPAPVLGFGYAVVLTAALVLAPDAGKAFIYFQF